MKEYKISAFGIAKEVVGAKVSLSLPDHAKVKDLIQKLHLTYPSLQELSYLMVAVNEEYAEEDQVISHNDEIVLIPPVSGG